MKRFTIFFFLALSFSVFAHEWKEQTSGTKKDLLSISSVTNKIAWISGMHGIVLRTVDEGNTWQSVGGGTVLDTMDILNIFAIDSSRALCSASPLTDTINKKTTAYIFKTNNGGKTWTKVFTQTGSLINGIFMIDSSMGVACGNPVNGKWSIWKTTDGGASWDTTGIKIPKAAASDSGWNNSVWGDSLSKMIAFGTNDSTLYVSVDSGKTWTAKPTKSMKDISAIFFSNDNGLLGGDSLLRTTDKGNTWRTLNASGTGLITGIIVHENWDSFMTRLGTKAAPDNHIYTSQNFGDSTWNVAYTAPDTNAYLYLTQARNGEGNAWAVRKGGGITYGQHSSSESSTSGVSNSSTQPLSYSLSQNYPNPFNPSTTIRFSIPEARLVSIKVYDVMGKEVTVLMNEVRNPGSYSVQFNASNLPSGIYIYRIQAGAFTESRKLVLLK
ncbi:MAG TPA: T9SS type A sorting domain-containing protein [Ignavibacteriales bacterium]|nr:T9SS type A sorting domain-containing protein [Ignavibacteriales bacterium]